MLGHYYNACSIGSVRTIFCNVAVSSVLDEQAFIWSVIVELQPNINNLEYRIIWLISACAYSGKRNDSMHLIKDMCLYGPQTFGHVMDARPASARASASWLD